MDIFFSVEKLPRSVTLECWISILMSNIRHTYLLEWTRCSNLPCNSYTCNSYTQCMCWALPVIEKMRGYGTVCGGCFGEVLGPLTWQFCYEILYPQIDLPNDQFSMSVWILNNETALQCGMHVSSMWLNIMPSFCYIFQRLNWSPQLMEWRAWNL